MTTGRPKKSQRDADTQGALIALLGALIVVLLLAANVQLAAVGGRDDESSSTEAVALPPPVQGTSNDVLADELRGLSDDLTAPLNLLRDELNPLTGLPAGQLAVADSFEGVAGSVRKLGVVREDLAALSAGIEDVVSNTEALTGVGDDISATSRMTNGMARAIRKLDKSVTGAGKSANESIVRMNEGIEAMRQSLASTSSETQSMGASLAELNTNMKQFLKLFCILLTSEPECSSTEATGSQSSIGSMQGGGGNGE
jgi:methyl-accepting chemotaxis protein